jgi:hypothetical protein
MANSDFISSAKNKILSDLQNDELFLQVIGVSDEEMENGLVYNRLFPFYYIYDGTQTEVKTYVCVEVDIKSVSRNGVYVYPTIIFNIVSHQDDVRLNMAGVSKTRPDYLGEIIDEKYNGAVGFGYGKLMLISNTAGSLDTKYRYRQLVFRGADINDNLCGGTNG